MVRARSVYAALDPQWKLADGEAYCHLDAFDGSCGGCNFTHMPAGKFRLHHAAWKLKKDELLRKASA